MTAIVTGAGTGIGREIAKNLAQRGYDLIIVGRTREKLETLKSELTSVKVRVFEYDLSSEENCFLFYNAVKDEKTDILINNAGFGAFGGFEEIPLAEECNMIDLNVRSYHILTKLFLADFVRRDEGYILNIASSAAFLPGPLMATYYATKAYVLRLTQAIGYELKKKGSHVYIGAVCPGPVDTEFNRRAHVEFDLKGLSAKYVADYSVKKMFSRKKVIIPGVQMKAVKFLVRFAPDSLLLRIAYNTQRRKGADRK